MLSMAIEVTYNQGLNWLGTIKGDRPAEGGERACNSRKSCIEGEMLAVTKFKSCNDTVCRRLSLIRHDRRHNVSDFD